MKSILLIDDDTLVLKSLVSALKKEGYSVDAVSDPKDSIGMVEKGSYDMIISDIRMPGINGLETLLEIRKVLGRLKKKKVPEILITGYADPELEKSAQREGVSAYLFKPFDLKSFLDCIRKHLR